MDKVQYAAIGRDGTIFGVKKNSDDAVDLVLEGDPGATIQVQHIDEDFAMRGNASDVAGQPLLALARCGIAPTTEAEVMRMTVAQAHAKLLPFFHERYGIKLLKRGKEVAAYDTPEGMADAWIGQNYKTSKASPDDEFPSKVMGLTLVPASHPKLASEGDGPFVWLQKSKLGRGMIERWGKEIKKDLPRAFSFCSGSTKECRDSCLAFAGQNASEAYNTFRKIQQSLALLREPAAFMRMLVESIERFVGSRAVKAGRLEPFFRLNVLSDIPWELVAPWLFTHFRDLQFYDYTKVPGRLRERNSPSNYDLTFSYAGTETNQAYTIDEVAHGHRTAVVLLGKKRIGDDEWKAILTKGPKLISGVPLPRTLKLRGWPRALDVVDGDVTDVRPRDKAPSVVALRWKTPSSKRSGTKVDPSDMAFVTPVFVVRSDLSQVARPRGNPDDDDGGDWLVAPVSPRMQPITIDDEGENDE